MVRSGAHCITGKSLCISVVRILDIIMIYLTIESFIIYYNLNDDTHIMNVMKWKIHLHGAGVFGFWLTAVRSLFSLLSFFKSVYFMLV